MSIHLIRIHTIHTIPMCQVGLKALYVPNTNKLRVHGLLEIFIIC